jgi:hypothetical protein
MYAQGGNQGYYGPGGGQMTNYYGGGQDMHNSNGPEKVCYQVDFNAIATGKVIAMSKRRIRWRYGFPNQEALNAGKAGTDCRGEEHDVTFVWSITSGKRMLMSNGQHLHVSTNKSKSFEYSWYDKNGNHLKVVTHSVQPLSNVGTVRQYDLFINGRSFFTLPKVYEVGLKTTNTEDRVPGVITSSDRQRLDAESPTRRSMTYSASGRNVVAPSTASQEENDLKRAIKESLKESRAHLQAKGRLDDQSIAASTLTGTVYESKKAVEDEPLIDFLSDPTPPSNSQALVPAENPQPQYQLDDPFGFSPQPNYTPAPDVPPHPPVDEFAPQAPTYGDISSQIMMGYGGNSAPVAALVPPTTAPPPTANTMASQNPFDDFPQQQQMNQVPQQQPMGYAYDQGQQQPQYYQQQAQQQPWNHGGY